MIHLDEQQSAALQSLADIIQRSRGKWHAGSFLVTSRGMARLGLTLWRLFRRDHFDQWNATRKATT